MSSESTETRDDPLSHAYRTAELLARDGDYDLAARVLRKVLESSYVSRGAGAAVDVAGREQADELEQQLMSAYAAYRMKLDDTRRPLRQTMARTALVSGIVAATFFASFAIAMSRLEALIEAPVVRVTDILDGAVQRELPRIVGGVLDVVPEVSALIDRELQNMSLRFSDYLEEKVDAVIEERIEAAIDERLGASAEAGQ